MSEFDRRYRGGGGRGGYNNNPRKRRHQDDDDHGDRYRGGGQRRRHDGLPPHARIRKQLLNLAESPLRRWHEDAVGIAQLVVGEYEDELTRKGFLDLVRQMALEQPLKTPFVAAVVLVANTLRPELAGELLVMVAAEVQSAVGKGEWREVKLLLKLLACLQTCLEGDGVFPMLDELFARAVDLQTASSEDTIGTELVKIILLTIPYVMAAAPGEATAAKASELMDKTDIIASEPHPMQKLIEPFVPNEDAENQTPSVSLIGLLQKQLQQEANSGWTLQCLPRPWKMPLEEVEQQSKLDDCAKHALPRITIPVDIISGPRTLFPEIHLSVYGGQEVQSVPPVSNIASSLLRDAIVDTINTLDFNRNVTARFLIDIDCFFSPETFIKRATPFDRLRDIEGGKSTWKPEDVVVDAVFSQLFQLPSPEHKLVYYHSVLIEACKIAPAAIAPSLGRAIRYLYRDYPRLDVELCGRFVDWFSHHLSNFGFTWKWTEWVGDVDLPELHPHKAFILGAIDKEIRLSFAQRIKNTLPEPYRPLIGPEKENDVPDFKFNNEATPFASHGKELASLLRRKAPDEEMQPVIERIQNEAVDLGLGDPLVNSTDVFMTAVLAVGSKSLSHVLACIERVKDRLLDSGSASEAARTQIITAVMSYWSAHPGVALCIVEKLLNYAILTPAVVARWAIGPGALAADRARLARLHVYELVLNTVVKVTGRVRQVVVVAAPASRAGAASSAGGARDGDVAMEDDAAAAGPADLDHAPAEVKDMRALFALLDEALVAAAAVAGGGGDDEAGLSRRWAERWLRTFRRRAAIEEAFLVEVRKRNKIAAAAAAAATEEEAAAAETTAPAAENGIAAVENGAASVA